MTTPPQLTDAELDARLHEAQGARWYRFGGVGLPVLLYAGGAGWYETTRPDEITEAHWAVRHLGMGVRYTQDLAAAFALAQSLDDALEVEFLITINGKETTVDSDCSDVQTYSDALSNNPARAIAEACALAMEAQNGD